MVDKAGDVAGADVKGLGELTKRARALDPEPPQDAHPSLAQIVALEPAIHHGVHSVGRQPEGGERFGGGNLVRWDISPDVLAQAAVVEATGLVSIDIGLVHI